MNDLSDQQLLRDYAVLRRETAFAELVRRYVDLVYSAALRMVRDEHLAQDVTQSVFVALAEEAGQLAEHPVLSGWLHCTARNIAAKSIRSDIRRRARELEAAAMNELLAESEPSWEVIAPRLDAALGELNEADRDALLLRYFEKKSASEMAGILGISDEAAQKRVTRAVERLRELIAKRGVTVGAGGLVVLITANAVQAAPVGLAAAISAAALAGAAVAASTITAATKSILMTILPKAVIGATLVAAVGTGLYEAHQAAQLRQQVQSLQQQQRPLEDQNAQLQRERDEATSRLAGLLPGNQHSSANPDRLDLLKLRGEVSQLRQALRDLPSARVALLKQKLALMPDKKIPEMVFLTDKDWLNAVWNADLDTDDGVRLALSKLRDEAVDTFLNLTRPALKKYLAEHNDLLPADLLALKPYYDTPVTDEMLQRYAFMQTGKISNDHSESVVRKAVYADEDYDSNQEMSLAGGGDGSFNRFHDTIYNAVMDYTLNNNGQIPSDPSQITPYLKRTVEPDTMQKYFSEITSNIAANPPSPPQAAQILIAPALRAYVHAHNGAWPKAPSDLQPYITTPQQEAALTQLRENYFDHSPPQNP